MLKCTFQAKVHYYLGYPTSCISLAPRYPLKLIVFKGDLIKILFVKVWEGLKESTRSSAIHRG